MNSTFALQLLRQMVGLTSLSGQERLLATFLVDVMGRLGFRSYLDRAGNAVGEVGTEARPLVLLLGHMDTVAGHVAVRQEGRSLFGRGVVDAKGSLATFVCAAGEVSNLPARLVVVGAVEEETAGSRGARHLLEHLPRPDIVIVGEPSGWSSVTLGYKGRIGLVYEVQRAQAHAASPTTGASEQGIEFWNRLAGHLDELAGGKSAFYRPTAALRRFDGCDQRAQLEVDCRVPPGFDLQSLRDFVQSIEDDGRVTFGELTPGVLAERSCAPARALVHGIRQKGGQPTLKVKTGTSDMNVVSQHWPVPMVAYGPGDSSLDHTPDEHLDLDEYLAAIEVLADSLRYLIGELARSGPTPEGGLGRPAQLMPALARL